ncbi:undecaprenyldiphospho-muramoylpentapeptide beta-N-acetylglucosaminyltransferase [Blattabacterium cuenoti]|nr:undecaprenyldiphospho-muramoylpentapeptide beta-N-acetylglucosaminyltransferase [Blattabacterium cuenoti]
MNTFPKILIGSGGSGGHVYAGIAIAEELTKKIPKENILFIGSNQHMEMKEIPRSGYAIQGIRISGGKNKFLSISGFLLLSEIIYSSFLVNKFIKNFSPNIVIGTGGFVTIPTLIAAMKNRIPILIQEQNSFPGLTNRIFSRYAKKICVAYEQSMKFFPKKKTVLTGNPIRSEIFQLPKKIQSCEYLGLKPNKPVILSLGGSQGSKSVNNAWLKGLNTLIALDIQFIWQTGTYDFQQIRNDKRSHHSNVLCMEFIENISMCYAAADVVVSRAGALTISEMCLIGKPYILIPFPWASDDHQTKNAQFLEKKQAAWILPNEDIEKKLVDTTVKLLNNSYMKKKMMKNLRSLGKPRAKQDIVHEILQIIL